MPNLYKQFMDLQSPKPLQVGTVAFLVNGVATITLPGGGKLQAEMGSRQGGGKSSYRYQTLEGSFMGGDSEDTRYRQRDYHTALKWVQPLSSAARLTLGGQLRTELVDSSSDLLLGEEHAPHMGVGNSAGAR